ncbi:MAG: hypothetical protein A2Y00_10505 [Omnitrophica WOR_2 bacterium GWF2_43_52]|nr:MAG: hypothetical protein A2062_04455 [Omnitrophica WOR_2 bacterium GWA2_44_7]OGX21897.1 MAG: hypothetical protein A2Y00_10505 [Omnitrophica WOR_2 bacterium GWF2_43_52]OGX53808.1 MAG: hypothetical protein A2460_05975 [Omnitrophica WOR_2 bacterium RIFOXYC2_FULL_43_9]HAH20165.1 hypothetical protein [Candidatus Omnitrophota bacterium]HBG63055.1 hypothetical protein [Candidatus Omnitrophota bacterium]
MKNKRYCAGFVWIAIFTLAPFSYAQMETESAESVPSGISDSDYQRLQVKKQSLDTERLSLESARQEFNSECGQVSSEDMQKVESCRLRYDMLNRLIDTYDQNMEEYKTDRDATKKKYDTAAVSFEKGVQGSPPVDLRDKNVDRTVLLDYETRAIDPRLREKVMAAFDDAQLDLEVVQSDPRLISLTWRLIELDREKAELDKWIPLKYQEVKAEIRKQKPELSEEDLAWEVFWDQRTKKVAEHARRFDRGWKKKKEAIDREFEVTLAIAKKEYAEKKAEILIRERWRKGLEAAP